MSIEAISDCAAVKYGDPDHLIIMFSSIPAIRRGDFDFKDFSKDLPQTILFLRDDSVKTGYHNGIGELTDDVDDTVAFIKYFIEKMAPKRVTMFGTSIGAYAALMYGFLVGVDDIVTVGAVSFVDPATRDALNGAGERVPLAMEGVRNYYTRRGLEPRYLDTWPLLQANADKVRAVKMYYTPEDDVDATQTLHVARLPNILAVPKPGTSHKYIALVLVRDGTLARDFATPVEELIVPVDSAAIV